MRQLIAVCILIVASSVGAYSQLNENCTVAVLNRTAQAKPDGTWVIPNIPANFGSVRARATCVQNGATTSGESALFTLSPNGAVNIPPIQLGSATPIPIALTVTAPTYELNQQRTTVQLTVTATYAAIPARNVTATSTGTTYNVSNPALATISDTGLLTARASGTVLVQAIHEGRQALASFSIALTGDSDGDGIPDDVERQHGLNPNDPTDALADLDGDGLSNRREIELGTDIRNPDTDGDTLSDGAEVNGTTGFRTNPLLADTDGDLVRDALEIQLGTDPTNPASVNLNAAVSSISVTPTTFTLLVSTINPNAYTQLNVVATLRDATTLNLTSRTRGTTYATSDTTICNFGGQDGRVFAGREGACTITVTAAGRTVTSTGVVRAFVPQALSQISIPGYANNVDAVGAYAYVAAGATGLQVVSVSNPSAPQIVGSRDTNGNANDVRVRGDFAYIADGSAGLAIINISNPAAPTLISTVDTPGDAQDVYLAGNFAYIADSASGLSIINITNPAAPILVSTIDTPGIARGVWSDGQIAVVADDVPAPGLRVINVTNASAPIISGNLVLPGSPKDVDVFGRYAVVPSYDGGSHLVDFTNASAPRLAASIPGSTIVARDVAVANGFAIFAEQLFPNAVAFADVSTPNEIPFRGILDFSSLGDYAGTGIAVNGPYIYMTGENFVVGPESGSNGNTRLFIGQYMPLEDRAGVPPTISLSSIPAGTTRIRGERIDLVANATDDVAVVSVSFRVNGTVAFVDTSAPYEYSFAAPEAGSSVQVDAIAVDLGGNRTTSNAINFQLVVDPLTTVTGRVLNEANAPVAGAAVTLTGGATGATGADGRFSIPGVSTIQGPIIANVTATVDGNELTGASSPLAPVRGGTTNVGDVALIAARWESNYGTCWSSSDDTYTSVTLPFAFPFYGTSRTTAFVGTNGYITFNQGDSTYVETVPQFNALPRIAAFFDDLYGRSQGCTYINATLPGRYVVTYDRVQHYSAGGSNTLQIVLFQDGRIQFGYRGITALTTGSIAGLTPGPNSPPQQVDYSTQTAFTVPAGSNVFEYFTSANPFDLDGSFIIFTPQTGGYRVRTILGTQGASDIQVTGGPSTSALAGQSAAQSVELQLRNADGSALAAATPTDVANAEVEVSASSNVKYKGMTNTDRRGVFAIDRVPRGGINVKVRRQGELVGEASAVIPPNLTTTRSVNLVLTVPANPAQKTVPAK